MALSAGTSEQRRRCPHRESSPRRRRPRHRSQLC
ncbi:TPA: hypothetical protein N0F65_005994 [Lagenidium giganteum]|uniref:Uncharacterized protein n=1 Tax=Lagenidium giganteum TaxID=4803 RepID=A0AAV2Z6C2_9STRA|nr:TPA: hypothetical protein N0F65_005994 [Lagenidium giganteum]